MAAAEPMSPRRRDEKGRRLSSLSPGRHTDCRGRRKATSQLSPLSFLSLAVLSCLAFCVGADHIGKFF